MEQGRVDRSGRQSLRENHGVSLRATLTTIYGIKVLEC